MSLFVLFQSAASSDGGEYHSFITAFKTLFFTKKISKHEALTLKAVENLYYAMYYS